MKQVIEHKEKCQTCGGTGLYVGLAERDGAAVVCYKCKGTGCFAFRHEYEPFESRVAKAGVVRVYEVNPGIIIGKGNGHTLEEFGGLTLQDWRAGKAFTPGTENREHTCPCWWYQSADYKLKPNWKECDEALGCTFSKCQHFGDKAKCWARWDAEFNSSQLPIDKTSAL